MDAQRRKWLRAVAALGVGTPVFHRALAALAAQGGPITPGMIAQAQWIAGLELSDQQRRQLAGRLEALRRRLQGLRQYELDNSVAPMLTFRVLDHQPQQKTAFAPPQAQPREWSAPELPEEEEDLAFLPVAELAALLRQRKISSVELTRLYLERLRRYDPVLRCVVTLTEDLAMRQARQADRELARGVYRGPLHGVPWGAKDLIAVPGYPTTWGAPMYRAQVRPETATVFRRLSQSGAVLVAKLSLGALAMGDRWFGGQTRNPWNPQEGSSGSSAGSAAAVAAGLVPFALGSETNGSIVSPCRRCGATGLRPTFGRVSRYGCMTLAWSMDKIGPIARTAQDCALVFAAIQGHDPLDPTTVQRPFRWPVEVPWDRLRVGYVESDLARPQYEKLFRMLRQRGAQMVPIRLPQSLPSLLGMVLDVEAACAFDELVRRGETRGLNQWGAIFRTAQFVPAVEYLRANRLRRLLAQQMNRLFEKVDLYLGGSDLTLTNLTGHPAVVFPAGFAKRGGVRVPVAVKLTGPLHGEELLLAVADSLQKDLTAHLQRPPLKQWLQEPDTPTSAPGA